MRNKVVVLSSGGLDSSVMLAHYKHLGYDVYPMYIDYGNNNIGEEMEKLLTVLSNLKIKNRLMHTNIDLGWSSSVINKGSSGSDGLYVNMRNLVFIANAVSYAESIEASKVAVGFIDVPAPYQDASPSFLDDINNTVINSCGIVVEAPLINLDKQGVYELGLKYNIALEDTISCNTPIDGKPCGICDDCKDIKGLIIRSDSL